MLDALTVGVRGGRWHALIDKGTSDMNLYVSACKVVGKKGSAGVDRQSTEDFSASQMAETKQLQQHLRDGSYRPQAARRVRIPKPGSNQTRPLRIATVRD
ncbi:MAG: hypothetical protein AB8B50_21630 [Pirellulaceae bacterium]